MTKIRQKPAVTLRQTGKMENEGSTKSPVKNLPEEPWHPSKFRVYPRVFVAMVLGYRVRILVVGDKPTD